MLYLIHFGSRETCLSEFTPQESHLFACSIPHDDLAIVAAPSDDLRLQWIALKAEYFIGRLKYELRLNGVSEIPDQDGMWSCCSPHTVYSLVEGLRTCACYSHHTLHGTIMQFITSSSQGQMDSTGVAQDSSSCMLTVFGYVD